MRKLEVIALNPRDAKDAELAGADRIELVSAMEVGGLSPELEVVESVIAEVSIPVNVMIRLKGDNFIYSPEEFEDLLVYLDQVKTLGINGIVFGSLTSTNQINTEQLEQILSHAGDLDVTFHRAIDEYDQMYESNFEVIDGKVTTLLTSGGTVQPLIENIERIRKISGRETKILVGGGINHQNYQVIFDQLPKCDFHIGSLAYNHGDFSAGINSKVVQTVKSYLIK